MTTKKPSPTAGKSSALAGKQKTATPAKGAPTTAQPKAPRDADGATLADILAVLKGIDAKLGALVPKPLEKL